ASLGGELEKPLDKGALRRIGKGAWASFHLPPRDVLGTELRQMGADGRAVPQLPDLERPAPLEEFLSFAHAPLGGGTHVLCLPSQIYLHGGQFVALDHTTESEPAGRLLQPLPGARSIRHEMEA